MCSFISMQGDSISKKVYCGHSFVYRKNGKQLFYCCENMSHKQNARHVNSIEFVVAWCLSHSFLCSKHITSKWTQCAVYIVHCFCLTCNKQRIEFALKRTEGNEKGGMEAKKTEREDWTHKLLGALCTNGNGLSSIKCDNCEFVCVCIHLSRNQCMLSLN